MKNVFKRFLNVCYVLSYIILGLAIFFYGWNYRPQQQVDSPKSIINCNNGKSYINTLPGGGEFISYIDGSLLKSDDARLRWFCYSGNIINDIDIYQYEDNIFSKVSEKNYSITLKYHTEGSWNEVIKSWSIGFLVIFFVIEILFFIIRYIFGYNTKSLLIRLLLESR